MREKERERDQGREGGRMGENEKFLKLTSEETEAWHLNGRTCRKLLSLIQGISLWSGE